MNEADVSLKLDVSANLETAGLPNQVSPSSSAP
jgi:hypothetical protein